MHPNCQKNLLDARKTGKAGWKKGQSGNPRGESISGMLRRMMDEPAEKRWLHPDDYGLTWKQAIAKSLLIGALKREPVAVTQLMDRTEGKVAQPIGGEGGGPIRVDIDVKGKIESLITRLAATG